jgi:uncharacterized membrane-anchored protein
MRVADLPALLLAGTLRKIRRRAVAYLICAACALGILIEVASAGRLALEYQLGPIGARLAVAAALLLVVVATLATVWWLEKPSSRADAPAGADAEQFASDKRLGLIAEAIYLGYTLARGMGQANGSGRPEEKPPERPQ